MWQMVDENYEPKAGELFRIGVQVKAPYSDLLAGTIQKAIEAGVGLRNLSPWHDLHNKTEIRRLYHTLPMISNRTGRSEPWWIYAELAKRTDNPVLPVIYGLIALIVVASTAVLISGRSFERFTAAVGGDVQETIKTVFNPGVILAAFILGFLFLTKR